jgi:2'-5' RNA ligase
MSAEMRLFFAFVVPESWSRENADALTRWRNCSRANAINRWMPEHERHITTAFLGETPVTKISFLEQIASEWAGQTRGTTLAFDKPLWLPGRSPSVLAAGYNAEPLASSCKLFQERIRAFVPGLDGRDWLPHITLARGRRKGDGGCAAAPPPLTPVALAQLALYESVLQPGGAAYFQRTTWNLS